MGEILTEHSGGVLRITLNRPSKKNAMTSSMYTTMAQILNNVENEDDLLVVLWDGSGNSFSAGNDLEDFLKHPPGLGESPQAQLATALLNFHKPLIAAVQGVAIGGGTTLLTHCDFVFAGETAKFQLPFINLGLVPEFGSTWSLPARGGYLRAAELILLGQPFDARLAAEIGLVTRVVPDDSVLATAIETAKKLAAKPPGALQACKQLLKRSSIQQIESAIKVENEEFTARVRSTEAQEAFTAFLEKRTPDFKRTKEPAGTR